MLGLPNIRVSRRVVVAGRVRRTVGKGSFLILTIPSVFAEDATTGVGPCIISKRVVISMTGKVRRSALVALSRRVDRRVPRTSMTILDKPARTRRIKEGLPASYIVNTGAGGATRCLRSTFGDGMFHICADPSVLKVRLKNSLGGIVTLTTKVTSNLNCKSGAGTTLVAHNVIRVKELNIGVNNGFRDFYKLAKVNSLVIAYTDIRDHGHGTNCLVKRNGSVRRTVGRMGVIIRNICSTGTTTGLTRGCRIPVPVMSRVGGILFRKGSPGRTMSSLVLHRSGVRGSSLL